MKLKKLKPITNGTRHVKRIQKCLLSRTNRLVRYIMNKKNSGTGRSKSNGRITVRHKGGGAKKLYRMISDAKRVKRFGALVISTCYDPNRNSFINLNFDFVRKNFFYSNATVGIVPGQIWKTKAGFRLKGNLFMGDRVRLTNIAAGVMIHNITSDHSGKAAYAKSAGTYGQIIQSESRLIKVRLPSNKFIELEPDNFATIGRITNNVHRLQTYGKAGVRRHMGIRPSVRGIAMNPVDHPHGGRTNGGVTSMTPWGLKCKSGYYLRKKKK